VLVTGWRFAVIDLVQMMMSFMHNSGDPVVWWDTVCPSHWGEVRDEAFDDEPLKVRQSYSGEEACEQIGLITKAKCLERRGLTKRKRFQWRLAVTQSMDNLFSNLKRLMGAVKQWSSISFIQCFHLWLDVGAVCVSSARNGYRKQICAGGLIYAG
jgi:hypothetical protein